jgi:hypothetical protein
MGGNEFPRTMAAAVVLVGLLASCASSSGPQASPTQVGGTPCRADELSPSSVMRSTDLGKTWTVVGRLCLHDPSILSVDFTALPTSDGGVALYFVDMKLIGEAAGVQRIIYRAVSTDGVNFDTPQPAITSDVDMFDPTVVRLPDGRVRMYVPMIDVLPGVASFISDDGLHFTRESGVRNTPGGMPGALLLADNRIRMFTGGMTDSPQSGIRSAISDDGLTFAAESGLRIAAAGPGPVDALNDPSAIRLRDGGYLMAFMVNPTDPPVATEAQYRLATGDDGFNWTVNPTVFAKGGTSCLVQTSDGALLFYYGV